MIADLEDTFGLGKPSVPVSGRDGDKSPSGQDAVSAGAGRYDDELAGYLVELGEILTEIGERKERSKSPMDYSELMLYIAGVKPRVSEMVARAKGIYARQFGAAFDLHYKPAAQGAPRGSGVSAQTAETRAKAEAALAYEALERLERTWRDLQDLTWAVKGHAEFVLDEERAAAGHGSQIRGQAGRPGANGPGAGS